MNEPQDPEQSAQPSGAGATLTDEEIETRKLDTTAGARAAWFGDDNGDTGDDSGDTGDDAGDSGDDSGDSSDTGDDAGDSGGDSGSA